ncbi:MAG: hydroxymethylbilane synthase [Ruminiclostridium sp.]|nr:hydroxymethylbilane synthase [Ruminiclostridium sp.]
MKIRIGTRKSKLALIQSELAANAIKRAFPDVETELVHITTKGDVILDKPLEKIGGKGVFIDEIERAMLDGEIDIAVHSAKDLPLEIADRTCTCAVLKRAEPHDILVTRRGETLPENPVIGTSSTRRAVGAGKMITNPKITDIRGNVDTRLNKLADGQYDAVVLAAAGLERLGAFSDERFDFTRIDFNTLVPAPCQGIIAVQSRDGELAKTLSAISDRDTFMCFETERKVLELLNAGCSSPAGAVSYIKDGIITLTVTKDQRETLTDSAPSEKRFTLAERLVNAL